MAENQLKKALLEELREAVRTKEMNDELLEHLVSSLRWLLHYAKMNNIHLPNLDQIERIVGRTMEITNHLPYNHSKMNTQNRTRIDETECLIRCCFLIECCKMSVNL